MDWKKELKEWVIALATAFVVGILLTQFVIISAVVPTPSMQDTIQPGDRLIGWRLSYLMERPERGEIVIFKFPDDETQLYVKRVIGLPGETVKVSDGVVYINDQPIEEDYIKEAPLKDGGPWTVPEDSYFMIGDNRNNSFDSRYWENTFVHKDKILGKVLFRYWPNPEWLG